ncbi:MAG: nucleotidyltransferase domain-containing protein [Egibacteraceae bacterium]
MAARGHDAAILLSCLSDGVDQDPAFLEDLVAGRDLGRVVDLAYYHHVPTLVYYRLRGVRGADPPSLARLGEAHARTVTNHLRVLGDLVSLGEILDRAAVTWAVFKGPVLAELAYPHPGLRAYTDLDLLVAPEHLRTAVSALEQAGHPLLDRNWEAIRAEGRGQLHVRLGLGTEVDLHWDLLIDTRTRGGFDLRGADLLRRRERVRIGVSTCPTFGATDTLLLLCVHAGLAGGHRLVWLTDLQRWIATQAIDWDAFVALAARSRCRLLAAVVLSRARTLLGAAVPDQVLGALTRRGNLRAAGALDRLLPPAASEGHYAASALWTRMLRDDWWATARAWAGKLRSLRPSSPQVLRALRRERFGAFDDGPMSPYHASGDAETREAFFREVSQSGTDRR